MSDGQFNAAWLLSEGQGVLRGPKSKEAARAGAIAGMSSALFLTEVQEMHAHSAQSRVDLVVACCRLGRVLMFCCCEACRTHSR